LFTGERPYTHVKLIQKLESLLQLKNPIEAGNEATQGSIKKKQGLYEFLSRCLVRDPVHRPSAEEVLKDPIFGR
jgi:serine/threonine protein kinase